MEDVLPGDDFDDCMASAEIPDYPYEYLDFAGSFSPYAEDYCDDY